MTHRLHVVIPAAGVGQRMRGDTPKQYLPLHGRTVIEWALEPFLMRSDVVRIVVAVRADDTTFKRLSSVHDPRIVPTSGGPARSASVLNGLNALDADASDWVLVHDAARPCLSDTDLAKLINALVEDEVGGLLAAQVTDTLKSVGENQRVVATLPRDNAWRALTPQMFRCGLLRRALDDVTDFVTDEAMAIERLGLRPKLIPGRGDNIKITVPEDILHAEFILQQRNQR
jgi:2-C-methyl-D-erythritol 4-phosphate cytidylyltransferase